MTMKLSDHDLVPASPSEQVRYDLRPVALSDGKVAEGLYAAWITLNNPTQYNSYTTQMVKEVILSFRRASNARNVVAVVFTGAGDRAFCTGGNTKEYAEYYAGRPAEYAQYMRLFNDMVTSILTCDKPVICRVNGMRVGGGQEIGMACDFTIASDLAVFGQAGPKHGSAPIGGATDFLPLFVGVERAMVSCTLCQPMSAARAFAWGLISDAIPVTKLDGKFIASPFVDERGELKSGEAQVAAKALMQQATIDLAPLDRAVEKVIAQIAMTMPGCMQKTVEAIRAHKLAHWDRNRESARSWLALNMMSEANAGFRAFNEGPREQREVDFVLLRQKIAAGEPWSDALVAELLPRRK
jgi:6-oxo-cyclohex-1-ene-carbonyl-CoA hydrolase